MHRLLYGLAVAALAGQTSLLVATQPPRQSQVPAAEIAAVVSWPAGPGWTQYEVLVRLTPAEWTDQLSLFRWTEGRWEVRTAEGHVYPATGLGPFPLSEFFSNVERGDRAIPPGVAVLARSSFLAATTLRPMTLAHIAGRGAASTPVWGLTGVPRFSSIEAALDAIAPRQGKPSPAERFLGERTFQLTPSASMTVVAAWPGAQAQAVNVTIVHRNADPAFGVVLRPQCYLFDNVGRVWTHDRPEDELGPGQMKPLTLRFSTREMFIGGAIARTKPAHDGFTMTCRGLTHTLRFGLGSAPAGVASSEKRSDPVRAPDIPPAQGPRLVSEGQIVHPESRRHDGASVIVDFLVSAEGDVSAIVPSGTDDEAFVRTAVEAIAVRRYASARDAAGAPVPARVRLTIDFKAR